VAACSGPGGSGRCTTSATASFFTAAPTIPLPRMIGSVPATMPSDNVSRPLVISGRDFTSGNVVQLLDSGGNVIYSEPPTTLLSSQLQTSIRAEFPVDVTLTIRVCRSATATSSSDCSSGPFTLTFIAVKRPDLVPRYLNNQPFAFPYTTLNVNVEVLNQGNGDAAPSQLFAKLVDSNGAIVTQGTVNVSSIAAGTTLPLTLTMPIPAPTFKTYCFSFVVDSDRRLNQSNTSNDSLSPQCFLH